MQTEFIRFRIRISGGSCEQQNEPRRLYRRQENARAADELQVSDGLWPMELV